MQEARLDDFLKRNRLVRFGAFELRLDTGELKKHGVRVRLQGKPFQILCALLERPGHVVTREELRSRVWSANTFVDFESGLNTAVNRLRMALGDSAENPIYIETLARLGYRFIAPIATSSKTHEAAAPQNGFIYNKEPGNSDLETHGGATPPRIAPHRIISNRHWTLSVAIAAAGLIAAACVFSLRSPRTEPTFHQVTFRKGSVLNARFVAGGAEIIYSAQWNGASSRVFSADLTGGESRDFGFDRASLASLSTSGELAILATPNDSKMVLEAISRRGGTPQFLSDRAKCADWGPGGRLAIVTQKDSVFSVEYPPGHNMYSSTGWINDIRVSPRGDRVAFAEHPILGDDAGKVMVVDANGRARTLSGDWGSLDGIAWHPSEREVWFTAARSGVERALMAVDMSGRTRQVAQIPGGMLLQDIGSTGATLITRTTQRMIMLLGNLRDKSMQDISWLDWSHAMAITPDGKNVLFDESGAGGGKQYSVYLYRAGSRSRERLGDGRAIALSDDGRWALTAPANDDTKLSLLSITSHEIHPLSGSGLPYRWVKFFPGGAEILFAEGTGGEMRIYRQHVPEGNPVLVKAGVELNDPVFNETGEMAVGCGAASTIRLMNLTNGSVRSIETKNHLYPVVFVNEHEILSSRPDNQATILEFLNLETGKVRPYTRIEPADSTGMAGLSHLMIARDLRTFVCSRQQTLSDLFVVSGWK